MPTLPEQLDSLSVLDTFNRPEENPMSRAEWTKLPWAVATGKVFSEQWMATSAFELTASDGVYWNAGSVTTPGVVLKELVGVGSLHERWIAIWAALNPATHTGYRLRFIYEAGSNWAWRLESVKEGTATLITSGTAAWGATTGRDFAITVIEGTVIAWTKSGGVWSELGSGGATLGEAGYSAIEGDGGGNVRMNAVAGGKLSGGEPAEKTVQVLKNGSLLKAKRWVLKDGSLVNA